MSVAAFQSLSEEEISLLKKTPALITVLLGDADHQLDSHEAETGLKAVSFRTDHGDEVVRDYYEWLAPDFAKLFFDTLRYCKELDDNARKDYLESSLASTSSILGKLDKKYAHHLLESWRGVARAVAQASGGVHGQHAVTFDERDLMGLNMITLG